MKVILFVWVNLIPFISFAQSTNCIAGARELMKQTDQSIFIFCRGSQRKSVLVAEKFNYNDPNSTHVGIGLVINGKEIIYNITDNNIRSETAFKKDTLESFLEGEGICYFSIWKTPANQFEKNKLIAVCEAYARRRIFFDASFVLAEDDTLYCSEFCARVLQKIGFTFQPRQLLLDNPLYESILGRKTLCYFPVDFFTQGNHFYKTFECRMASVSRIAN